MTGEGGGERMMEWLTVPGVRGLSVRRDLNRDNLTILLQVLQWLPVNSVCKALSKPWIGFCMNSE